MAGYFQIGEVKVRPGAYFNVGRNDEDGFGAVDGIVAVLFKSDFGPLCTVTQLDRDEGIDIYEPIYGTAGTTDALRLAFEGGAKTIIACRVGHDGAAGTVTLKGTDLGVENDAIKLTALYPGSRPLSVSVRKMLSDERMKELTIYDGTKVLETVSWMESVNDVVGLEYALRDSRYVSVEVLDKLCSVSEVQQKSFEGGKDPTTNADDYSAAMSEVEKYFFNAICVDTEDVAVHELVSAFLDRIYQDGCFGVGFVAEKHSESLDRRISTAAAYDKENMAYVLNSYVGTKEGTLEGYQTAALIAGAYAAAPANTSLTHQVLDKITDIRDLLTNSQIIRAEKNGCIVLSYNSDNEVWIDYGINTMINTTDTKDAGWKKLRRVKTRYELLYRANAQADALVGKVDNDKNGRMVIIGKIQKICNDMIDEGKLLQATVAEHPDYVADGDTCYFKIDVVDKDSAEHIYLFYRFQFSTAVE